MQEHPREEVPVIYPEPLYEVEIVQPKSDDRLSAQERRNVALICVLGLCLSLLYALLVRPGSAADEPAHYHNVQYYANHHRLPVLGEPDVSYEGQMGPVYYSLAAVVYKATLFGGEKFAFYAVRCASLLLVIPEVLLAYLIVRRLFPRNRMFATATAVLFALNAQLAAIASSIQNDMLAIVLSMLATYLSIVWLQDGRPTVKRGVALGVIIGVAILAKATVTFMLVPVPFFAWLLHKRKSLAFSATFVGTVAAVSGWWFARNFALYGDISAQKGLTLHHFGNNPPPHNMLLPREWAYLMWNLQSHYWYPVEYYRDLFHIPLWLRLAVVLVTLTAIAGWFWRLSGRTNAPRDAQEQAEPSRLRPVVLFLGAQYVVCMAIFIYTCHRVTYFAPRTTLPTYIAYATMLTAGGIYAFRRFRLSEATYIRALGVVLLVMNAYCLYKCYHFPIYREFHLFV